MRRARITAVGGEPYLLVATHTEVGLVTAYAEITLQACFHSVGGGKIAAMQQVVLNPLGIQPKRGGGRYSGVTLRTGCLGMALQALRALGLCQEAVS